jgi:3-oxoacyl-[acyl-carrier protein] reductase
MGRHLVGVLLRRGHQVMATDLNDKQLRDAMREDKWESLADASGGQLLVRSLNVCDRTHWQEALGQLDRTWDGLDVCLNIAGMLVPRKIQDVDNPREIDLHIDVMIKGPIHGTQLAAELMARRGIRGHVVNVSSMAAIAPVSGVTLYATAKFGCRGFSLAANKDLAPLGIAVTCLMPDAMQTPMVDLQLEYDGGAYAYSGRILSVQDLEQCLLQHVLPDRPAEVWLSPRVEVAGFFGIGGMVMGVIHSSRVVQWMEAKLMRDGLSKQKQIKAQMMLEKAERRKEE